MDTEQKTTQVPPQEIVSKLSRLSVLLSDLRRVADERNEKYYEKISIGISSTNTYETIEFECGNGYAVHFETGSVYMFLTTPKGGRMIFDHGTGAIGDIAKVPLECWDRLNKEIEELIRRKLNEIEYLNKLYYTYKTTA